MILPILNMSCHIPSQEYVNTAGKVLAKGGFAYVTKELARLDSLIAGKSLVAEKKAAFQLRRNVLAAFQVQPESSE